MVNSVLQTASVPAPVVQEIVTHAAGNPFFLEELAWHVIEHGGGPPAPLAVPETIEAVLAARIDRLPPEEKRLLQTTAVIGMAVSVPLLQAVTTLATAELHTHLGHLQTAEFLYETGRLPAAAYTFKHALTHEVAYGSLLQERRRVLHGRAAQAIEGLFAERLPEHYYALAHHYSRSGHPTKAVDYLQRAGLQAVERSAYTEAISHMSTALDLLTTLPETPARHQHGAGPPDGPHPGVGGHQGRGGTRVGTRPHPRLRRWGSRWRSPHSGLQSCSGCGCSRTYEAECQASAGHGGTAPRPGPTPTRPRPAPGGPLALGQTLYNVGALLLPPGIHLEQGISLL